MKKTCLLLLLLLFPLASSKVIFTDQPDAIYSLGDTLKTNFYIENEEEGYVECYLDCDDEDILFFKQYLMLSNDSEDFQVTAKMTEADTCKIKVVFGSDEALSDEFDVSNKISLNFTLNSNEFFPLEILRIEGTAIKANGEEAEGTARIKISSLTEQTVDLSDGEFSFEYALPSNAPSKKYTVEVEVTEEKNSMKNTGEESSSFKVNPKPSFIKISAASEVKPPSQLEIKFELLDQEFEFYGNETVMYKVYDPANEIAFSGSVLSGDNETITLKDDASKNGWKINAYFGNVFASRQFFVQENKKIRIEVENNSNLIKIINIGNTFYEGVVNVEFRNNDSLQIIPINVNLSRSSSFTYAVELRGDYNLSVEDIKSSEVELNGHYSLKESQTETSPITGAVIGSSFKKQFFIFSLGFLAVLFIFSLGFFSLKNTLHKKKTSPKVNIPESIPLNQKRIYTLFLNIEEKDFSRAEKIVSKNYKLHKINHNQSFVMFYASKSDRKELSLISLVRELKKVVPDMSSIIHCENFENKATSIQSAFVAKQLMGIINGNFITGQVYDSIKSYRSIILAETKSFHIKEKVIKLYEIKV